MRYMKIFIAIRKIATKRINIYFFYYVFFINKVYSKGKYVLPHKTSFAQGGHALLVMLIMREDVLSQSPSVKPEHRREIFYIKS